MTIQTMHQYTQSHNTLWKKLSEAQELGLLHAVHMCGYKITVWFTLKTDDATKLQFVGHVCNHYGFATHMVPDFKSAVIHLHYRSWSGSVID